MPPRTSHPALTPQFHPPPTHPPPRPAVFTDADCVNNGLYMGRTEFEALAAPADWWLLHQLGPRFALFAAPSDIWFKVGGTGGEGLAGGCGSALAAGLHG